MTSLCFKKVFQKYFGVSEIAIDVLETKEDLQNLGTVDSKRTVNLKWEHSPHTVLVLNSMQNALYLTLPMLQRDFLLVCMSATEIILQFEFLLLQ